MKATANQITAWMERYIAKPIWVAGFFVLVALLWTFLLQHIVAYPFVFLFFGAIMGSAWFGGLIAGLWAILLSSVLIDFFFMPPLYSLAVASELRTYQGAFIICAIAITAISVARRRIEDTVRAARDELEDRVRERTAELEQSNLEILERERQLRLLTEAIPQQIWRADVDGRIEYCNHDLLEFTGKHVEELQGDAFYFIFHPSDAPIFRQSWDTARRNGQQFESQLRVRAAGGSYRWFLIRGIPQHTVAGEVSCWYGVHIDIEEQYRAHRALLLAQGDSARWSRTLSMAEMAASIAHELKQPLTALMAQAQACRRWLRAEPMHADKAIQAAESLVRESARAGAVIDHVRSLFSEKDPFREPTDLNALLRDAAQLLRDEAVHQGVSIHLNLAQELPLILVDPVQLRQLAMNLVLNGMESTVHTGRAGELTLRTAMNSAGKVILSVLDNGIGLTAEAREKMFDPFFTTKPQGTGIGLSICRSIAEAHDGRIWAEPLEQGTAFHVVLGSGQ